ncbi:hypothetical protein EV191_113111 [Tamaricihabitans halophyticus]|uniref:Uncharacterized protein n=1 Tax=Tamaricihabitans halophyticus TaxID=1262583 RepID=A0A4R2QEE4_9PSEU|nr:hypothetical protein [Tamaricihabitans halophyticus]TCP46834.1 hypothetical protein EV191_113111 [Tamaricihabitans halophyticus]
MLARIAWPYRAALAGVLTLLVVGVPTDIIDTPLFSREVPVRWWEYPVLAATILLTAAWFALPGATALPDRTHRTPLGAVLLAVFAVGCPVCNKIILIVLGTSGALSIWAPIQPFLALISLALLSFAIIQRWRKQSCSTDTCATQPEEEPARKP